MIKYSVERARSYQFHLVMFSFACTHSSTRFLIRRARRATISRVYSFAYTRNFVLEGNYIPTTNTMTARRSVAQVSLAFSSTTNLPELNFVCVFGLFTANAPPWPAQLHAQKPHGLHLDLNFVFPHRAHFSLPSLHSDTLITASCHALS